MKKSLFTTLVLLTILGVSQPLWGGTVYSYAINQTVDGNPFTTQIRLTNDTGAALSAFYLFIPANTNGANFDRDTEQIEIVVPPRTTQRFDDLIPAGRQGLLEFELDDGVFMTSRLVGTRPSGDKNFGVELPVIDSVNAMIPGRTAVLQGAPRTAGAVETDFFIANLSIERTECAVEVRRPGGPLIIQQVLGVAPLSLSSFRDVLNLLGVDNVGDTSIAVTCDQLARPFGIVRRLETAEMLALTPSGSGKSTLDPFPSNDCPPDALFQLPGVFHVPTNNNELAKYVIPTTPGERYSRIIFSMEFTHGGWNRVSSGNHSVFWLQRTSTWSGNLFGYLNLFGPNKNNAKNITNINLPRGVVNSTTQGGVFEQGETYVVFYTYDAGANFIESVITRKGGGEVIRMTDRATVNNIVTDGNFQLVFGHTSHEVGPEVTTIGWRYANACLQLQ